LRGASIDEGFKESLPRTLGIWSVWLLAVNGLIGAGIFGLPSEANRLAGEYSVFVYLLCALLFLPIVYCFAELASVFHGTGGPIRYSKEAFGPLAAFQTGWLLYVSRVVAFAANSALLVDNIGYFWPAARAGSGRILLLTAICGGLTFFNVIGSVRAMRSLALLTVIKISALLLIVVAGIGFLGAEVLPGFESAAPSASNFGAAALLLIYAYAGFENAVIPAGETRNPSRDMPLALLLSVGTVTVLYVLIQIISEAAVPGIAASSSPLLDAAGVLIGPAGGVLLMLGVIASVGGNLIVNMFGTARTTYALSLDGNLPRWFGAVNPKFQTPTNSIVCFGVLALLLALFGSFRWLVATVVFSRLIVYVLVCVAVPLLRKQYPGLRGFRAPGGYLMPILGIAACGWLTWHVAFDSLVLTGLTMVGGAALYFAARREVRASLS